MDVTEKREADENSHSALESTAVRTLRRKDGGWGLGERGTTKTGVENESAEAEETA